MKIDNKRLKQIILQEIKSALNEIQTQDDIPYQETDSLTKKEVVTKNVILAASKWAKQLTPVKYRQFLEDVKSYYPSKYSIILSIVQKIMSKQDYPTAKDSMDLFRVYKEEYGKSISNALLQSGYVYEYINNNKISDKA